MFSKLAIVVSLAVLAVATPTPGGGSGKGAPECSTGPVQCCDSVQSTSSPTVIEALDGLGIDVGSVNVPVGLNCDPITVIGTGSNSCTSQTVCCENNSFKGVVALGCTPVNINV